MSILRASRRSDSDDDTETRLPKSQRNFKPHKKFTADEDLLLEEAIAVHGDSDWSTIVIFFPGRTMRQCRDRWTYYLSPSLNHRDWTPEQDALLLEKQRYFGSRWVQLARFFPNRTDAMVKYRWQLLQRRKAREQKKVGSKTPRREKSARRTALKLPQPSQMEGLTLDEFDDASSIFARSLDSSATELGGCVDVDWFW
jgi:hypothetical protein